MNGPETIYAWRYTGSHHEGQWNRSKLSHTEAEYIRADIADAAVAAAYEAAAVEMDLGAHVVSNCGIDEETQAYTNAARIIRALTLDDAKAAMEAVRREARAEALREAADLARENWRSWDNATPIECDATACEYISDAISALIDKETTE